MKRLTLFSGAALALLMLSQPTKAQQHPQAETQTEKTESMMPEHCRQMMLRHTQMTRTERSQDLRLKQLTENMHTATGERKIRAMATVINALVEQRTTRQEMHENMQSQMMGHMMEHMQSGDKSMMMECPMMHKSSKKDE